VSPCAGCDKAPPQEGKLFELYRAFDRPLASSGGKRLLKKKQRDISSQATKLQACFHIFRCTFWIFEKEKKSKMSATEKLNSAGFSQVLRRRVL
jgi:hypothetical protein